MYPYDAADISHECPATVCSRKVFLYILPPHTDHRVAVIFIQFGVASGEGEGVVLGVGVEEFGKCFLLDRVDDCKGEPACKGW